MGKIQMYQQRNHGGERYVGLTLAQVAKAMWAAWKKTDKDHNSKVLVDFASNTDDKFEVYDHHGLVLQSPFDSLMLVTGGYGGYDFGAVELTEAEDKLGYGLDWQEDYPNMTRPEAVLCKSLEGLMWDEWKDENGLLWCDVKECILDFYNSLQPDEVDIISVTTNS